MSPAFLDAGLAHLELTGLGAEIDGHQHLVGSIALLFDVWLLSWLTSRAALGTKTISSLLFWRVMLGPVPMPAMSCVYNI
jgi:hypothetical protein